MKIVHLTYRLHTAGDAWPPPAGALDSRQRPEAEVGSELSLMRGSREALLAFFEFPAEHWDRLRT